MPLAKDELVEVEQKDPDGNGWWLVKKNGRTGWAPSNYLKEAPAGRAAPPAPRARAPAAPNGAAARTSVASSMNGSGISTPNGSVRGSASESESSRGCSYTDIY